MRVIISAGGTGGHIYPALAIINKIKEKEPNSEILYIGTHNRMEKDIIPQRQIPYEAIEMYGFSKKIFKNIKTAKCLIKSFQKCKKIIKEFNPDIVIGVGGYVTVPVIVSAKKLGFKTFIHEQNIIPGKANRYLEKYCDLIGVSFEETKKYFTKSKVVLTGNPCSEDAVKISPVTKTELGLSAVKKLVLVVTGSLGSKTINNYLLDNITSFKDKNYEVLFITGKNFYEEVKAHSLPDNVKILPFYEGLTKIMKRADLIVTRAGASTLSEIIALKVPSILIPSPYVANNHQYLNAKTLTDNEAAMMIEEKDLNGPVLISMIDKLLNDPITIKKTKENLDKMNVVGSASIIYAQIKDVVK